MNNLEKKRVEILNLLDDKKIIGYFPLKKIEKIIMNLIKKYDNKVLKNAI